jgi:hypothetical protein
VNSPFHLFCGNFAFLTETEKLLLLNIRPDGKEENREKIVFLKKLTCILGGGPARWTQRGLISFTILVAYFKRRAAGFPEFQGRIRFRMLGTASARMEVLIAPIS